jgi:hypothetical protein
MAASQNQHRVVTGSNDAVTAQAYIDWQALTKRRTRPANAGDACARDTGFKEKANGDSYAVEVK